MAVVSALMDVSTNHWSVGHDLKQRSRTVWKRCFGAIVFAQDVFTQRRFGEGRFEQLCYLLIYTLLILLVYC